MEAARTKHRLRVDSGCMASMEAHAVRTFPRECCGVLIGRDVDGVREVLRVVSVEATQKTNRYFVAPEDLLRAGREAEAAGLDVVGIYHSHPNCSSQASEYDRRHALPFWSYLIVSCVMGEVAGAQSWRLRDDGSRFDEEVLA